MLNPPKSLAQARKHKYHRWQGNPSGNVYSEGDCAWEVWDRGVVIHADQCSRKNGHGPDGLYCKQHAKKMEGKSELNI